MNALHAGRIETAAASAERIAVARRVADRLTPLVCERGLPYRNNAGRPALVWQAATFRATIEEAPTMTYFWREPDLVADLPDVCSVLTVAVPTSDDASSPVTPDERPRLTTVLVVAKVGHVASVEKIIRGGWEDDVVAA